MTEYLGGYVGHEIEGNEGQHCEVIFDLDGCVLETEDGQVSAIPMTTCKDDQKVTVQLTLNDLDTLTEILDRCYDLLV